MSPVPVVLAFHKLMPEFSFGSTNFSPGRFDRLLTFLTDLGYDLNSSGTGPHLTISFDDGYQHLLTYLPELVQRHRFTPIVFMPTSLIGQPNAWDYSYLIRTTPHLDKESVLRLAGFGVEFGSHGHTHTDLTGLSRTSLEAELRTSKSILEDILKREVTQISYPFGRSNVRVTEAAARAGYTHGYTMDFPSDEAIHNPLTAGRVAVYGYDTPLSVLRKLRPGPFRALEQAKARITNRLSGGTVLLNRLRGR